MSDLTVNGVNVPFLPVGGAEGLKEKPFVGLPGDQSFDAILEKELHQVRFSKHAQERLEERKIVLNEADTLQLERAVAKAEEKGAQDALVLLRDLAFIVNIKNKMVVTAMSGERLQENVFTNIDSAVIAG
jgi:flagellar operon protein